MNSMSHQHNQHHPHHGSSSNLDEYHHSTSVTTNANTTSNHVGATTTSTGSGCGVPAFDDSLLHDDDEDNDDVGDDDDLNESGILNGTSEGGNGGLNGDWNPTNTDSITKPGTHDVLLGRGGGTNNHIGNVKFRKLVNEHKMRYLACSKVEKPKVARQVVALWRKLDPPGRFLTRADDTKRGPGSVKASDNVWFEVGDKKAREKASQCLRERTPDVMPYIKHLREQQNALTEQGVSMVQRQMQQHESSQQQQRLLQQQQVVQQQQQQQHSSHHLRQQQQQQQQQQQAMMNGGMMNSQFSRMAQQQQMMHPNNSYSGGFDPSYGPSGGMMMSPSPTGYGPRTMVSAGLSPGRRSSLPMAPLPSGNGNMSQQQLHNAMGMPSNSQQFASPRRTSLPLMANMSASDMHNSMGGIPLHHQPSFDFESHPMVNNNNSSGPLMGHNGSNSDYELSEMEYQQQMMLMQQQMMQQQMQMQCMQQSRQAAASLRNGNGNSGSGRSLGNSHHSHNGGAYAAVGGQPEPLGVPSSSNSLGVAISGAAAGCAGGHSHPTSMPVSALKTKRGRGGLDDLDHDTKAAPDRTTSLMSLTPLQDPAANTSSSHNDQELSLEDYRQQLEEYIANSHHHNGTHHGGAAGDNDDGEESDLEDDWEKERERAVQQAQQLKRDHLERGVHRNASGMSILSKASAGGMSLVSGFSGLSDLLKDENKDAQLSGPAGAAGATGHAHKASGGGGDREHKMNMARSVSSNLSLMSELTDLSQNIDNLSIYDD
jgi:hypothetical protein